MSLEHAADVVTWRYPAPYECYDMTDADPDFLAGPDNNFFALLDSGQLIGFRSFGADGQVPGGKYDAAALDTGGGLRPELVGQGIGYEAIRTGLEHGRQLFHPAGFRVTIAAFNIRALRVVDRLGFSRVAGFEATTDGRPYGILVRTERNPRAT